VTKVCAVVITAPDVEWLAALVRQLVSDRLCASGHVTPIRAVYRWRGEIYDKPEGHATLHTRFECVPEIIDRVARQHPYEVPCTVATPITGGSAAYIEWILEQTRR
jgi:periplasmic divalent cation tolerance protein